jgi:hypothetical protein
MRRGIARLSLLFALAVWAKAYSVPWREKNVLKVATSLPTRLIDSIMAQGNWNILFQEGPFNEFQRQIAIANHFALRGDSRQATFYFQKAGNALDIAYASFRGRFGWPRDASGLRAASLPGGENRETFEDFLLCRLQLQIESTLTEHESGILKTGNIAAAAVETEKQLSIPIGQKDADLENMMAVLREASAIRSQKDVHPTIQADKFAAVSDRTAPSTRNYWNRRLNVFRIFENIHHGNLGRAYFFTRFQEEKLKEQADSMSLARIYIQLGAFEDSLRLLTEAVELPANKVPENYGEYLGYSTLIQNIHIWHGRYAEAEKASNATQALLDEFLRSESVPRDELVGLKKNLTNEILRSKMYSFIMSGKCQPAAIPGDTDMEKEWQIREKIFHENCTFSRDAGYWSSLTKGLNATAEIKAIVTFHLADDKIKMPTEKNPSPLTAYLTARKELQKTLKQNRKERLAELTIKYIAARNAIEPQFILFDWGLNLTDDLSDRALAALPQAMSEKIAPHFFAELNRRFIWEKIRNGGLQFFAPADAAQISRKIATAILDFPQNTYADHTYPQLEGRKLVYSDSRWTAIFDPRGKKQKFMLTKKSPSQDSAPESATAPHSNPVLYGAAISEWKTDQADMSPFRAFCAQCAGNPGKGPERLVILAGKNSPPRSFTNDLADNFSIVAEINDRACPGGATKYEDSVILSTEVSWEMQAPCNLAPEKIIIEYDKAAIGIQATLALGWRPGLALILMPQTMPVQIKTSFLFDFFQRTNRRQVKIREAFREAKSRAEKSFPTETALKGLHLYETLQLNISGGRRSGGASRLFKKNCQCRQNVGRAGSCGIYRRADRLLSAWRIAKAERGNYGKSSIPALAQAS